MIGVAEDDLGAEPSRSRCGALTEPCVPTGMNAGVCDHAVRRLRIRPRRAAPSVWREA